MTTQRVRCTDSDGTVHYYGELVKIVTGAATCDLCCRPAKRVAVIHNEDGTICAAHKCARFLLGYDPFVKAVAS